MKSLNLIILLFILPVVSKAQQDISPAFRKLYQDFRQLELQDWDEMKNKVNGSPYFYNEFKKASILSKTQPPFSEALVRYNILNDQMELKMDNRYFAIDKDTALVYRVNIGEASFEIINIPHKGKPFSYAEIIAHGNYSLYAKHKVSYRPGEEPKPFQDAKLPQFTRLIPELYLKTPDGKLEKIKNFKQVSELIPAKSEEINRFVKKEKLKFRNPEDQKALFKLINK